VCAPRKTCFRLHYFSHDDNSFWKVLQLLVRGMKFFCPPKRRGSPSLLFRGYQRSLAAVELPEREVEYSPEYNAEVKDELSYTFSLLLCALMGRTETALPFY